MIDGAAAGGSEDQPMLKAIRRTGPIGHMIIVRAVVAIPLMALAILHLGGAAPMRVILEAAHIPWVGFNAVAAPIAEGAAAAMILTGAFARVGAAIGCAVMLVALYAHWAADWEEEPPLILPLMVLGGCAYILIRGSGAWGWDSRGETNPLEEEDPGQRGEGA